MCVCARAAMAKTLSPTKTPSKLSSPTKTSNAPQLHSPPDGSRASQPRDVVQLASSMVDRIVMGGGLPARVSSARGQGGGAPARPSFGTTNKPVRPHTAHAASSRPISAMRITGEDGAHHHPVCASPACARSLAESRVACLRLGGSAPGSTVTYPSHGWLSRGFIRLGLSRCKGVYTQ